MAQTDNQTSAQTGNQSSNLQDRLTADLKEAMMAQDARRTSVLRSLKSAITYAKVAPGAGADGPTDDEVIVLLAKEAKKRQESADSYLQAGRPEQADDELAEKNIIEEYLPRQLSEDELRGVIEEVIAGVEAAPDGATASTGALMGRVMAAVKAKAGPAADGARIAQLVKDRLAQAQAGSQ